MGRFENRSCGIWMLKCDLIGCVWGLKWDLKCMVLGAKKGLESVRLGAEMVADETYGFRGWNWKGGLLICKAVGVSTKAHTYISSRGLFANVRSFFIRISLATFGDDTTSAQKSRLTEGALGDHVL
ncbi:hypothetical protein Tco_1160975 [Tanacetum coccineum]